MTKKKRILIADDHELIHIGIANLISKSSAFDVIGHAYTGEEAISLAQELKPDILFIDISMPKCNGIDASIRILDIIPETRIIAISQYSNKEYISQMFRIGCYAYLSKSASSDEIIKALKTVSDNKRYINPEMIDILVSLEGETSNEIPYLTQREQEIILQISHGKSNAEIAAHLSISVRTVETHRRNLMQKLQVNNVVDLLKSASANKLVQF